MMKNSNLGLYLHIPFCVHKCNYCDFLSGQATPEEMVSYCHSLCQEMSLWSSDPRVMQREVDTIFLGGGTPSLLSVENISQVIGSLYDYFRIANDAEFSIECNPGTVTKEKLQAYYQLGVNRLSLGMQSTISQELEKLGRIHTYDEFVTTFHMARETGFTNINVDVMAAIPKQTVQSYQTTLQRVLELEPEHISSYSLIIEEGTPFYEKYQDNPPVDEETDRKMYEMTAELLAGAGYKRYEISNYAKEGYSCKHNLKYWHRDDYLGLGLGAASFLEEERFYNTRVHSTYQTRVKAGEKPLAETEVISRKQAMAEFMYLGLRCMQGVSVHEFECCFQVKLTEVYGHVIDKYVRQGLLIHKGDTVALTNHGIDVSNLVFADFI